MGDVFSFRILTLDISDCISNTFLKNGLFIRLFVIQYLFNAKGGIEKTSWGIGSWFLLGGGMWWVTLGFTGVGFGFLGSWGICGCSLGIGAVAFGGWRIWCGPISGCMLKCGSLARREGLGSECLSCLGMKCCIVLLKSFTCHFNTCLLYKSSHSNYFLKHVI